MQITAGSAYEISRDSRLSVHGENVFSFDLGNRIPISRLILLM